MYALDYSNTHSEGSFVSSPTRQRVEEAEYWEKYYDYPDVTYEWNDGYLEEKPVSTIVTVSMYKWFFKLLESYLTTYPIAESMLLEIGFDLTLPQKSETRRPDLGVVLNSNPVPLLPEDRSYKGTFDLCVEAISDSSKEGIERDTQDKKDVYAQAGVKEYYILDGQDRYLEFYHLGPRGVYLPIKPTKMGIIKSTVLPGFQFRIADLFTKPSPDDMIDDPIYKDFVLPGYSKAIEKAEAEKRARQKAEQQVEAEKRARQKAEQQVETEQCARQEAETEIARLMALLAKKDSQE